MAPALPRLLAHPDPAAMRSLSLEDLLTLLDRPAHQLVETSRGLRLRRPRLRDGDVCSGVDHHAAALRVAHRLDRLDPLASPARRAAWRVDEWGPVVALHARWMAHLFEPPAGPVVLRPGIRVTDWERFGVSVAERYASGPGGPYADGLRADLRALFDRFVAPPALARPEVPAFARAA